MRRPVLASMQGRLNYIGRQCDRPMYINLKGIKKIMCIYKWGTRKNLYMQKGHNVFWYISNGHKIFLLIEEIHEKICCDVTGHIFYICPKAFEMYEPARSNLYFIIHLRSTQVTSKLLSLWTYMHTETNLVNLACISKP